MINRLYIKDLLSFKEVELNFKPGLIVLTGPSGAGKSLLMNSILSLFGLSQPSALLCEIEFEKPSTLQSDSYILDDTVSVKSIKKSRISYYLDGQKIAKNRLKEMLSPYFRALSVRDRGGFDNSTLISVLDRSRALDNRDYEKLLDRYKRDFRKYETLKKELNEIKRREKELFEKREFLEYEIEKIDSINPKVGEYEELLELKKRLSRVDRINEAMDRAVGIFEFESAVIDTFDLMGADASYFTEAMNQLRGDFDDFKERAEELAELDVETILERLEALSYLRNRYGSVEEALSYREKKRKELDKFKNIEKDKSTLEKNLLELETLLDEMASEISSQRKEEALKVEEKLSTYLEELKLPFVKFVFFSQDKDISGKDRIDLELEGSSISTLSGGEFNRLRLALLSVVVESEEEGVIFLDEIDANVSGDESIAIANMLSKLSKVYQIFAISHQAHLTARANQHILVRKDEGESVALDLDSEGRIKEIARIIGGEKADEEAYVLAKKLRDSK